MSRYNRLSSNFSFVFLVLIIVLCASWLWQTETRSTPLDYSQVRQLFIQEKVERFTIDSNYNLTMTLREARDDSVKTLRYRLFDFQLFYDDLNELVQSQYAKGILTGYDYPPPETTNWLEILLPGLLILVAVGLMGYLFLFRAQGGGMSLTALSGACTAEEMSPLPTLLQKPESLANADKSLPDYIRVIKESAGRRRGETPADPLLAAQDRFKEKKGYGGKQT